MIVNLPRRQKLIDQYTKFLLHFEGANNSTVFTDEKGHSISVSGNPKISTDYAKFGSAAGKFTPSGYLKCDGALDWAIGYQDFTVDMWLYTTASQANGVVFDMNTSDLAGNGALVAIQGTSLVAGYIGNAMMTSVANPLGQWNHIAFVRDSTSSRLYLNGTYIGGTSTVYNLTSTKITIGTFANRNNFYFNGYIDEFRLSTGIARWTANFTPPTAPYSL